MFCLFWEKIRVLVPQVMSGSWNLELWDKEWAFCISVKYWCSGSFLLQHTYSELSLSYKFSGICTPGLLNFSSAYS